MSTVVSTKTFIVNVPGDLAKLALQHSNWKSLLDRLNAAPSDLLGNRIAQLDRFDIYELHDLADQFCRAGSEDQFHEFWRTTYNLV